jgi:hypothetical protein
MKTPFAIAAFAAVALSPVAHAGEGSTLAKMDTNANGSLSLAEVQAAKPAVTAETFAVHDTDKNGELSQAEVDAWKAAKAETAAPEPAEPKTEQ